MHTAHDARCVPLLVSHVLHRRVRTIEAAMKGYEEINTTDQDDPEQEERQGAEMIQRVPLGPKRNVEP